jgi:cell division protein FtsQ
MEKEVADYYLSVRGPLAQANLKMQRLSMDDRGAVRLFLEDGQEIRFGQNGVTERLDRFFTIVVPTLVSKFARVRYVDLRYINGFAVRWLPEVVASQVAQTQAVTDSG